VRADTAFVLSGAAPASNLGRQSTEAADALRDEHSGGETCHGTDKSADDDRS
jgi:hypothetical protein